MSHKHKIFKIKHNNDMNVNDNKDVGSSTDNVVHDENEMGGMKIESEMKGMEDEKGEKGVKPESKSGKDNEENAVKAEGTCNAAQSEKCESKFEKVEEGELALMQKKCGDMNDKYLRLAAEFDNYRRRSAKERLDLIGSAGEEVIKGLLPVLDDCERAIKVLKESNDVEAAKEGTELIYNKLMAFLKGRGLAIIEARGKTLDTDFHEAAAQFPVEEKEKKNKIIDVIQEGYTLNGKVIRFAKVVVGI